METTQRGSPEAKFVVPVHQSITKSILEKDLNEEVLITIDGVDAPEPGLRSIR